MRIPEFLTLEDVLRIHQRQIERFGGTPGIRNVNLLESALAQLVMNHPFVDGNKRTAFAVMDTFLRLNGVVLTLTQSEKYEIVIHIVEGKLGKEDLATYLEQSSISRF